MNANTLATIAQITGLVLALLLVVIGLRRRRVDGRRMVVLGLVWLGIVVGLTLVLRLLPAG